MNLLYPTTRRHTRQGGLTMIEMIISIVLASIIFLIIAQLLSSSLRQEQRLLRLYQLNSAANRAFNTVNDEIRWSDQVVFVGVPPITKLDLNTLDDTSTPTETRQLIYKARGGTTPPQYSLFYFDGVDEVDLLPGNIELVDIEFENVQNVDDTSDPNNPLEYRPLVVTTLTLKSTNDDTIVVERQTAVANLDTQIELPSSGAAGGTPFPTTTPKPTNTPGGAGWSPCTTCQSDD